MLGTGLLRRKIAWTGRAEVLVKAFALAALTALGARIAILVPGTPVPMTLQVFAVLLAGLLLDGRRGALSQVLYLGAGLSGLPVFASNVGLQALLGPTGGYLVAFPMAALTAGAFSRRFDHLAGRLMAAACGVGVIYAGGMFWLALWLGAAEGAWDTTSFVRAWRLGVMPFVLVDLAKGALAALVADRGRWFMSRELSRREKE